MKLGEWKMAHTYLSRATRAQPPCAHAWYDLGVTCTKQHAAGIKKTARRCFKHALSIDPQHALAHYDLARLDALSGNRDRAFRHLIRAIDLGLEVTNRVLREPDMKSLRRDVRWKDISRRLRRREKANAPACRGRCYAEKGNAIMARMEEVFARVDDTFARISRNENGRMVPERFDPATGEFVLDWTYLTKLTSPEHAGVDSYWRLTREEFDAEVSKLKG
jgi:hypothetical protein